MFNRLGETGRRTGEVRVLAEPLLNKMQLSAAAADGILTGRVEGAGVKAHGRQVVGKISG